jgi:hypothetical protein
MDRMAGSRFRFRASQRAPRQNHAGYLSEILFRLFTQSMPTTSADMPAVFAAPHKRSPFKSKRLFQECRFMLHRRCCGSAAGLARVRPDWLAAAGRIARGTALRLLAVPRYDSSARLVPQAIRLGPA